MIKKNPNGDGLIVDLGQKDKLMFNGPRGYSVYLRKLLIVMRGDREGIMDPLAKDPTLFIVPVGKPGDGRREEHGKEYWDCALRLPVSQAHQLHEAMRRVLNGLE